MADLKEIARAAIRTVIISEGSAGKLGRADGTLAYSEGGSVSRNKCWARIGNTELVVSISGVPLQPNLPVIIAIRGGVPTVIRTDTERASEFTGGRPMTVAQHAWMHDRLAADPLYITGLAFLPLMAYPNNPLDLTVNIAQGFYTYLLTTKFLPETNLDLSTYLPSGVGSQQCLLICLDRAANTLSVVDGGLSAAPWATNPFTATSIATILNTLAVEVAPLAALRVKQGQTTITGQSIFMDLRRWVGDGGTVALFNDAEGDPANVTTTPADGTSLYPARRDHAHTIAASTVTAAMLVDGAVLAEILDDDGPGSLLDADLLDGVQGAGYSTIAHTHAAGDATTLDGIDSTGFSLVAHTHAYQPLDAELTALAGLTSATDTLPYFTGSGTAALATFTAAGRALVDDADATAQRVTLGLVIGTNVQAYDAELAALAGLVSAADRLPYFTGSGTASLATFTAAGRAIIDDADATAQRATLGLGSIAVETETNYLLAAGTRILTGDWDIGSGRKILTANVRARDANGLQLYDDGGNGLFVLDGGNVGIGTVSPTVQFQVEGAVAGMRAMRDNGTSFLQLGTTGSGTDGGSIYALGTGLTGLRFYGGLGATELARIVPAGFGIGVTSPQGFLHVSDGIGRMLFVSKSGIVGSNVTLIPDAAGDVTKRLNVLGVATNGLPQTMAVSGSAAISGTVDISSDAGTNQIRITVNADGSVTVVRTFGTATWTLSVLIIWQ